MKKGESYKYLGQDENLGYVESFNKERVTPLNTKRECKKYGVANLVHIINI